MAFVVALESGAPDVQALATWLAITPYEARQRIAPGLPAVLLQTPDRDRAVELVTRLRAAGHGASACDGDAVVPIANMTPIRDFRFDDRGFSTIGTSDVVLDTLAWNEIVCLIRAAHDSGSREKRIEKETTISAVRVLASGGILNTKTTRKEVEVNTESREGVLIFFHRRDVRGVPWILRETHALYTGLGAERAATTLQNFTRAVERIRAHGVPYDDRLVPRRSKDLDLLVHLVAMSYARQRSP